MTSVRSTEDLRDLDERCRSSDIALVDGKSRSYIALLNDGQTPAYAVIKVCSSVPSVHFQRVEITMLLHCLHGCEDVLGH